MTRTSLVPPRSVLSGRAGAACGARVCMSPPPFQIHVIWHGVEKSFGLRPPKVRNQGSIIKSAKLKLLFEKYDPQNVSTRKFVFLYHGGLLWRKGIDRLIQAYVSTFTHSDDVVLIIHYAYNAGLRATVRQPPPHPLPLSPRVCMCVCGRPSARRLSRPVVLRLRSAQSETPYDTHGV